MAQARGLNPSSFLYLSCLFLLAQICSSGSTDNFIVAFDAGSLSTVVHVFRFDENSNLLKIDGELDLHFEVQTGLIEYAENPEGAASLLAPLLQNAVNAVPATLHPETPLIFGAADELWLLGEEKCDKILEVVCDLFSKSPLLYDSEWIKVLPGAKQGAYLWASVNYLLGNMRGNYSHTVSVLDQERASIETAYAVSKESAKEAKREVSKNEYITKHYFNGTKYYLYSHSYWNYGAYAARGKILKYTNDSYTYCVVNGYDEQLDYYGVVYNVRASPSGSSYEKCRTNVLKALNLNATCHLKNCTFNGVWNGGGGAGVKNLYIAGGFHHTGSDLGIVKVTSSEVTLMEYEKVAKETCAAKSFEEAHKLFPNVPSFDLPYLCMDLVYLYAVLADGLAIEPTKVLTAVYKVKYGDSYMEVAWPLGAALEIVSTSATRKPSVMEMPFSFLNPSVKIV